ATRAAVEEGVVTGGGVALLRCQSALEKISAKGDEAIGVQIILRCLEAPIRQLLNNAGIDASIVVAEVKKNKGNIGYNVATRKHVDLFKDGVIDPTKVARTAIQNAASIAALMLTTECMVTEIPEEEKSAPMPQGGPGGMGGMGGGMGGMGGGMY
ncbi:TCP-1/cpn60 chaperonin family protein, partial [Verrucomicrobiota bacterium]